MTITRKKLIEVALPLEAINAASAREKSIRHGHPSTLHLWWARRPLAAARAVIFAQMVDDPSAWPDLFPTEKAQDKERKRLFGIIEELVKWENTTNEAVLQAARDEIWASWRRACADNADHPQAAELFDRNKLPAFHDPFAGGGALPLEAQRLGLESYASDLNPVAVLINKAMIEIPPKFAGLPPVNPEAQKDKRLLAKQWKGAEGLAKDVRYYGKWMRDEAYKRIGHLYPPVEITKEMVNDPVNPRPDLKKYIGRKLTVIAWIWARTVKSPNPAFSDVEVPLASTFMLSAKKGKEAYVEPLIKDGTYRFLVKKGKPQNAEKANSGTKLARANFKCVMSDSPIPGDYIKVEGKANRIGVKLMTIVVEGDRERVYLPPSEPMESTARSASPAWEPEGDVPTRLTGGSCVPYGLNEWRKLFTHRQLVALTTFSGLVSEVRKRVEQDSQAVELVTEGERATEYAKAIGIYMGFGVDYAANYWSSLATPADGFIRGTFSRQALPMTWDFAEAPPFGNTSGNWSAGIDWISKVLENFTQNQNGRASQSDAATQIISDSKVVSTDPPYYDNIAYADLSDFFYIWLRHSQRERFGTLFATLAVPKNEELVATAYRHGGKDQAESFFLNGMTNAMNKLATLAHGSFPVTIYYAFKQSETKQDAGTSSTGWETFLEAVIRAGFALSGTWPIRTERGARTIGIGTNALASSIVLVCRPRPSDAPTVTRGEFRTELKKNLPKAIAHLQAGNIAPVDLAQSAIGPGMAVFTKYSKVLDVSGQPIRVRDALALINEVLDEILAEQEGDFDVDTRWAVAWFEQQGFAEAEYGVAETLSKAKNTSVSGLVEAGILQSGQGKVCLLQPEELPADWDPTKDRRLTVWEMVHHLIRVLQDGEEAAAALLAKMGSKASAARELAYRLYAICERKKRAQDALRYNTLVQSWPELLRLAQESGRTKEQRQGSLLDEE